MNELYDRFAGVFEDYAARYRRIFRLLYPAKNSTGFTERNMSVNFSAAYEAENPEAASWFEYQFGAGNREHYDAVIVNPGAREILLIEAKRLKSAGGALMSAIEKDVRRINSARKGCADDFGPERIAMFTDCSVYGVILADVWTETGAKKSFLDEFKACTFVESRLRGVTPSELPGLTYFTAGFAGCPVLHGGGAVPESYNLLALIWSVL